MELNCNLGERFGACKMGQDDLMSSFGIFNAILSAVTDSASGGRPALMIMATSNHARYAKQAENYGIILVFKVFADRAYTAEGKLMFRSPPGAVLSERDDILEQVRLLTKKSQVRAAGGQLLAVESDTLGVHGDNEHAIQMVADIRKGSHGG